MADGLTAAAAQVVVGASGIVGIATYFPGIDLSAVIGAFGGAFFFILFAKDISSLQRVGYLVVGWIGGYFGAAELLSRAWTSTAGFSSFVAGLMCVVLCISVFEAIETGTWPEWLKSLFGRVFGRGKTE